MAGKKHRQKGDRLEREVVNLMRSYELEAKRVPLSGAVDGYKGDVICAGGLQIECKARARGFTDLYNWLEGNDALVIKQDRKDPLLVLNLARFCRLLRDWERQGVAPNGRPEKALEVGIVPHEEIRRELQRIAEKHKLTHASYLLDASGKE